MESCCDFLHKFKSLHWNKTTIVICFLPFVLLLLVLLIMLICSAESLGAVVSNSRTCAKVGAGILEAGGSAADAAIATMLCEGIALPNSAGIGGGFTAIMHIDSELDSIVATPTFPCATADTEFLNLSYVKGPKAAGVPGELMGYWEMHQKYGVLPWKRLIEPSIKLCNEGIPITEWLAGMLRYNSEKISQTPSMRKIFPRLKHDTYQQDFKIKFPILAQTLQKIADHGVSIFYEGDVGKAFIRDIQKGGGIITLEDLKNYKVLWNKNLPSLRMLQRYKIVTTPLPTSGVAVVMILNIIKSLKHQEDNGVFWHYVVEAMKHSFAMSVMLGDADNDPKYADVIKEAYENMSSPDFARGIRDQISREIPLESGKKKLHMEGILGKGSANICVLAPNGDVVAATSSLLHQFGAFFCSEQTGIIVNNLYHRYFGKINMPNRPIPNKHILTAYTPVIVLDKLNKPFFIVGASGGPRGIALVVNAIIRYLLFDNNAYKAVNSATLFAEAFSNLVEYEGTFKADVVGYLRRVGYKLVRRHVTFDNFTAANCIGRRLHRPNPQFNIQVGGSSQYVKSRQELGFVVIAIIGVLCLSVFGLMLYEVLNTRKPSSFLI